MSAILSIDPGNIQSAFIILDADTYKPIEFDKVNNTDLLYILKSTWYHDLIKAVPIEMIASYGMPVGKEVFDTCVWIGEYKAYIDLYRNVPSDYVYRREVKMNLCGSSRAKDGNVIQALKDRFGDRGTKSNPGWFYGVKADVWQAYAVGVTYLDRLKENRQ